MEATASTQPLESVRSYLDLSTGHMEASDARRLAVLEALDESLPVRVSAHDYGWIVFVPGDTPLTYEAFRRAGLSDAFCNVVRHAREHGIGLINFDVDGTRHPVFPFFSW